MIIIAPYAKKLRNGGKHPKDYPYWGQVIEGIDDHIVQIGVPGEAQLVSDFRKSLSMKELAKLVEECDTWISVDSFFQHFCWDIGKKGIVLFGQSDPLIFGHPENINLLKNRSYLRSNQFVWWEQAVFNPHAFVSPEVVVKTLNELCYSEVIT